MLRVLPILVLGLLAAMAPAALAAERVDVTVQPLAAPASAPAAVLTAVTFSNRGARPARLPIAALPDRSMMAPLFAVTLRGRPVRYTAAIAKQADQAVVLAPGATLRRVVDLRPAYAFTRTGTYVVRYAAGGLRSPAVRIAVAGRPVAPAAGTARVLPPAYASCTADEQAAAAKALDDAQTYVDKAQTYLAGQSGLRYQMWFGVYDATRWGDVGTHFANMAAALDNQTIEIDCTDVGCSPSVYAFVQPLSPYTIHVCGAFWAAPAVGTDSKAGTIIHELSHFTVIAATDDYVYGKQGAAALAVSNPVRAVENADNHEYFAENNGGLQASSYELTATRVDFGMRTTGTTVSTTITLTSTGDQALAVSSVTPTGDYAIASETCTTAPITPSATCSIVVAFSPTAAGVRTGTVGIVSDAYMPIDLALTGIGAAPAPTPAPAPVAAPATSTVPTSTPAATPTPTLSPRAGKGSITLKATGAVTFRLEVKRGKRWVAVGTYNAKAGTLILKAKRGTYRIVTDPKGAATKGKAITVR